MQDRKKRIFMVGYSANRGGVETYIDQLIRELPQYEIICSFPEMNIDGKIWRRPPNRHHYIRYRLFWDRFFRENRFDVIYYNTCDIISLDMLRFAKRAGVPVRIIHSHNTGNQQDIGKNRSLFHRMSERINRKNLDCYATHLLACSEEAGRWMFGRRPFTVIRNGIDIEKFRYRTESRTTIREQYGFGENLLVGVIGRLSAQKNPEYALRILEALFRMEPSARAFFAGDGLLRRDMMESADRAGIGNRVLFTGTVDNVPEWMSAADVLLMPSLFEGFPFTLVEAQTSGLPCVVSSAISQEADLTGLIHFVEPYASAEEWTEELLKCAKQKRTDCTDKIIAAGYSARHTAEQVKEIIDGGGTTRN